MLNCRQLINSQILLALALATVIQLSTIVADEDVSNTTVKQQDEGWKKFKLKYNKLYANKTEETYRYGVNFFFVVRDIINTS
jgi:hypothetical protein